MGGSLFSAFNANISGLAGVGKSVGCYAQNIASAGAVGSKERGAFQSVINTGSTVNNFSPSGITTSIQHFISKVGDPTSSNVGTNMAIQGQGFFVVNNNASGVGGSTSYTRNGSFREDKSGNFVNEVGEYLQIFKTDATGKPLATDLTSTAQLVTASSQGLSGNQIASSTVTLNGINLSSTAAQNTVVTVPCQIWDSLGVSHTVNLNFTKSAMAPATWTVVAAPTADVTSFSAPYDTGMNIIFDNNGNIASINGASVIPPANNAPQLTITWANTAAAGVLSMDFGQIGNGIGIKASGTTADTSTPPVVDGRGAGKYIETVIDQQEGQLIASFEGGDRLIYGKIPLATFKDTNQLLEQSGGVFLPTTDSGTSIIDFAGKGRNGSLLTSQLEASTIDSAAAFTGLIVEQQRYTTNLKCISTVQEMLSALTRTLGS